jgi:hypothetical protein
MNGVAALIVGNELLCEKKLDLFGRIGFHLVTTEQSNKVSVT